MAPQHDYMDVGCCWCVSLFVCAIPKGADCPQSSLQYKTSLWNPITSVPPINKTSTPSPVEDQDDPPAISMEDHWRSMEEIKQEVKHKVEEEIKEREKNDIGDVVKRIRESAAVKAAEAHCLERELMEENQ